MMLRTLQFSILVILVIALSMLALMLGENNYSFNQLFNITTSNHNDYFILHDVRLPRLIINLYCGMLFALAGSIFQAVYKNPVVSPDILGVNAVALFAIVFFSNLFGSQYGIFIYALMGVVGGFWLTMTLASTGNKIVTARLIVIGLAMSILFRAFSQLFIIQANENLYTILAFLNGSLSEISWNNVASITYPTILFIVISLFSAKQLDFMLFNSAIVKAIGINTDIWRVFFIGLALLMSAVAVSVSGSLGFVGLIAPNISRLLFGFSHRYNLYGSLAIGCILVLASDLLARLLFYPVEIPTGLIMIFIGAPIFIFLLKQQSRGVYV